MWGRLGLALIALEHLELMARLNRDRLEGEVEQARTIVVWEAARVVREEHFRQLAQESTQAILQGRLSHLDPADREQILRFTSGLAQRFARQPSEPDP